MSLPECESCGIPSGILYRQYPSNLLVCCHCRDASRVVVVPASKGGTSYRVTVNGPRAVCTCKGYHFHGYCKHATAVLDAPQRFPSVNY